MKRQLSVALLACAFIAACGPDETGTGDQNGKDWMLGENNATSGNNQTAMNNATSGNNQTSPQNNATSNNATSANNQTSPPNNSTSPPNNQTSPPNNTSPACGPDEVFIPSSVADAEGNIIIEQGCQTRCEDDAGCGDDERCYDSNVGGVCGNATPTPPNNTSTELCGNGQVDADETCDGDCPTSLNDCPPPPPDACVRAVYTGSADTCDATCGFEDTVSCQDGDGCCPMGCDNASDNDCAPPPDTCGNGQLDDNETCDGDCPQSIDDCPMTPAACTSTTYNGSAAMCTAQCTISATVACINDDACCPTGCDSSSDNDCQPAAPVCGDGMIEGNELCDGDCPSTVADCDDSNACTTQSVTGSDCQRECVYQPVTSCAQDGCCNGTCLMDPDCSATDLCGQPIVQNNNGPASVISTLAIEDQSCCFDYTGDNQPDNALGQLLDFAGLRQSTNMGLQQGIDSGSQAIVLEHNGINGTANTASYVIHVLDGAPQCFQTPDAQGGNVYQINGSSYDAAGQPVATLPMTSSTNGMIASGQGYLPLIVDFVGANLVLPIRLAQLEATISTSRSSLPDKGIALDNGILGGVVKLTELYDAINDFTAANCSCYTNTNPNNPDLVIYSSASNASCNSGISANACGNSGVDAACRSLIDDFCSQISFIPLLADVNSNAPGTNCGFNNCDAFSIGASFTAHGAIIQ